MPAVLPYRLRPVAPGLRPLLHLGLMLSLSSSPFFIQASWADDAARRSYQVPAGPLSAALTRFAGLAGVNLSVDPQLVSGRNSSGLSGEYGVEEGFARLLQGSGLQLQPVGEQAYILTPAPQGGSLQLAPTSILGASGATDSDVFAGGQVARRSSQGLLGSKDFMETPFSMTTYTSEVVKNQQARTLGDLIASDPSVRATNPAGGRYEQFTIRGFSLFNSDVAYNGLYGVLPTYTIDMEMADRVDILKGPTQLINGISPRGSVGGGINVVPKRATDKPITELTGSYASDSQVGGAVDIGRRFGEDNKFGVRLNAVKQSGDTKWDHQSVDREMAVLGLDFRGERLRLSTDIGHTERDTDAPRSGCRSVPTPRCRTPTMCGTTMRSPGARRGPRTPSARSTPNTTSMIRSCCTAASARAKVTTTSSVMPCRSPTTPATSASSPATSPATKTCAPPRRACAAGSIPAR